MENLHPCSLKCLKSVAVMVCVWLPLFLFFIFYLSIVCYKQLVLLVSLAHFPCFCWQYFSLHTAFSIHLARKTYFLPCSGFWNVLLTFFIVVLCTKSNRCLQKTKAIFLNFVVKTAKIWLLLGGFFCVFSQSETICNLHSCYKFALWPC